MFGVCRYVHANLLLTRLVGAPGGVATWQVVGEPLRVVSLGDDWMVVAVGDEARRQLIRHDLLARRFSTRAAAVRALGVVLSRGARPDLALAA